MAFLGKNIKLLRELAGLTQEALAEILGCSRSNVVSYEIGTIPKLELLLKIVNYFNTTVENIYTLDFSLEKNKGAFFVQTPEVNADAFEENSNILREGQKNPVIKPGNKPGNDSKRARSLPENTDRTIPGEPEENVDLSSRPNSRPISKRKWIGLHKSLNEEESEGTQEEEMPPGIGLVEGISLFESESYHASRTETVAILDAKAAADFSKGYLEPNLEETVDELEIPQSMLANHDGPTWESLGFPILNDRMHPTLQINDILIISQSDIKYIQEGKIYVIVSRSKGVLVNRLKNRLHNHHFIRCSYDNPMYESFNIREKDISSVYEAKFKISFNLSNQEAHTLELIHNLEERIEDLEMKKDAK